MKLPCFGEAEETKGIDEVTQLTVILVLRTPNREAMVREALSDLDCEVVIARTPSLVSPSDIKSGYTVAIVELGDTETIARFRQMGEQGPRVRHACLAQNQRAEEVVDAIRGGCLDVLSLPLNAQRLRALLLAVQTSQVGEESGFKGPAVPVDLNLEEENPNPEQESHLTPIQQIEKAAIVRALRDSQWNAVRAADALGIGGATVYRKIKRYGIDLKQHRKRNTA